MSEPSLCTKCGHTGLPSRISPEKKNPAIGMAIGAGVLLALSLLVAYGSGTSNNLKAGCSGMLGGGCLAGILFIVLIVCVVVAVGKAMSNARLVDQEICPSCNQPGMIPMNSPVAQKFLAEHSST